MGAPGGVNAPEISVVIPTLNEEAYLPALLDSLAAQSLPVLETLVVDAGSTDGTESVARARGAMFIAGSGLPGPSRNLGVRHARGGWLLFLDADVRLPPDALEDIVREVRVRRLDAASCAFVPDRGGWAVRAQHRASAEYFWLSTKLRWPHSIGGFVFVRRSLHEAVGGFDETVIVAEDQDYVLRLSRTGRYGFARTPVVEIATRRFTEHGLARMSLKWLAIEAYRLTRGEIRDDRFRYFP